MSSRRQGAGYTLIEVLVAMVILALALPVLLRIFSGGLRNIDVSGDYTHAVMIAEAQLNSAGSSSALVSGSSTGVADEKFRWTQSVQNYVPYPNSETTILSLNAYTVTVDVEWPHADSVRRVSLSSIKLAEKRRSLR